MLSNFKCTAQKQSYFELSDDSTKGQTVVASASDGSAIGCYFDPRRSLTKVGAFSSTNTNFGEIAEDCLAAGNCNTVFLETSRHEIYRGYIAPQ